MLIRQTRGGKPTIMLNKKVNTKTMLTYMHGWHVRGMCASVREFKCIRLFMCASVLRSQAPHISRPVTGQFVVDQRYKYISVVYVSPCWTVILFSGANCA